MPVGPDVEGQLAGRAADLVVGVLACQHARTVAGVVRDATEAVRKLLPDARALIVVADAGSTDGTAEAATGAAGEVPVLALAAPIPPTERAAPPASGHPGAAAGFRVIARAASATGARAGLLVGADLQTLPVATVERLLRPVWEGELDLAVPRVPRHLLDGTLTTLLLYPLTRALYGTAVRQPIASEAAFSAGLLARLLEAPGWGTAAGRVAPLVWTTVAAATGARLGEAWLPPRVAEPREGRLDLGALLSEVVGGAFALAELYEERWREAAPLPPPRQLGEPLAPPGSPPAVNVVRMVAVFRQGVRDLAPLWEQALSAETVADVYPLADLGPEEFAFPPELWARVVYDALLAWRFRVLHRGHLLRSLVPLYLGRTAALAREAAGQPPVAQERLLEHQAQAFLRARAVLTDRWR
jgi:hypothetical protein